MGVTVAMSTAFNKTEAEHLLAFIGYGHLQAPTWFLGMEEAGGGEANLRARLKFDQIEDLRNAHLQLGIRCFHDGPRPKIQRTWRGLSYIMLRLNNQEPTRDAIRKYQSRQLGRSSGETLLLELMPIPKPTLKSWDYGDLLPEFQSREEYYRKIKPQRIEMLQRLIRKHSPRILVAYGKRYWNDFRQLFADVEFSAESQFEWAVTAETLVVFADHFTAPSMNGKLENLVDLIRSRKSQ